MSTENKCKVSIKRKGHASIRVYARIHPFKKTIYSKNYCVKDSVNNNFQILRLCPPMKAMSPSSRFTDTYDFTFEKVFSDTTTQRDIFEIVAAPIVDSVLTGINGTIFAYGQTGTGKTYTMTGGKEEGRGLQPRIIQYIFSILRKRSEKFRIALSYLEIYNEVCLDLLNPKTNDNNQNSTNERVSLLEDTKGRLHVRNLTVQNVDCEEEALHCLTIGDHNRSISATPDNPHSSRSHCMLIIHLDSSFTHLGSRIRAKLNIVDLAGSERLFKPNNLSPSGALSLRSGIEDKVKEETKHINLSLHYLEQVIICLSRKCPHVPYRNSMMTTLLRDSLGGNCLTVMIATLSLALRDIEETISTCRFAQRVALVCNIALPNELPRKGSPVSSSGSYESALSPELKIRCEQTILEFLKSDSDKLNIPLDHEHILECFRLLKERAYKNETSTSRDNEIIELRKTLEQRNQEITTLINLLKKNKKQLKEEALTNTMIASEKCNRNCHEDLPKRSGESYFDKLQKLLDKVRVENFFESKIQYVNGENENYHNLIAQEVVKLSEVDKTMLKIYLSNSEHTILYDKLSEEIKNNYQKMEHLSKTIEKEKNNLTKLLNSNDGIPFELNLKELQRPIDENLIYLKELRNDHDQLQKRRIEAKLEIFCNFKKWLRLHSKEAEAFKSNNHHLITNQCYNFIIEAKHSLKLYLKKYGKSKSCSKKTIQEKIDDKMVRFNFLEECLPTKVNKNLSSIKKNASREKSVIWESEYPETLVSKLCSIDSQSPKYPKDNSNENELFHQWQNISAKHNFIKSTTNRFQTPVTPVNEEYLKRDKRPFDNEEIPIKLPSRFNKHEEAPVNKTETNLSTLDQIRIEIENQYRSAASCEVKDGKHSPSHSATSLRLLKNNNKYNITLTGDPEVDEEIRSFYSAREKLIQKR